MMRDISCNVMKQITFISCWNQTQNYGAVPVNTVPLGGQIHQSTQSTTLWSDPSVDTVPLGGQIHLSTQYHLVVRFTCQHSTTWWSDSPINTVPHGGQVNQLTPYTWWSDSPVNTVHMVVRFTSRHSTHGGQIHQSTQYHMVVRFISQRSAIWRSEWKFFSVLFLRVGLTIRLRSRY